MWPIDVSGLLHGSAGWYVDSPHGVARLKKIKYNFKLQSLKDINITATPFKNDGCICEASPDGNTW